MFHKTRQISEYINNDYKDYALYTISSRGIPSFFDTLTPLHRLILTTAPTDFRKTLNLVGDIIKGYHHGDASLSNGISRLARPYLNAVNLLEGDGFFGSPVDQTPASPRYTSVKINPKIKNIIDEYKIINDYTLVDYSQDPLKVNFPIGLLNFTIGIAVGFATRILPRKFEELEKFMKGNDKADLTPYLQNYNGSIKQADIDGRCWLFQGDVVQEKNTVRIYNVPPFIKYKTFLEKLNDVVSDLDFEIGIDNNSKDHIDFTLKINRESQTPEFIKAVKKIVSVVITENITFTESNRVLEYANIKDYLIDFRNVVLLNEKLFTEKLISNVIKEIQFVDEKIKFIEFMVEKKRSEKEIELYLKKFGSEIKQRLNNIKIRELSIESLQNLSNKTRMDLVNCKTDDEKKLEKLTKKIESTLFSKHNIVKDIDSKILSEFKEIEQYVIEDEDIEEEI